MRKVFLVLVVALLVSSCASNAPLEFAHVLAYSLNGKSGTVVARVVCKPVGTTFSEATMRFGHEYVSEGKNHHAHVLLSNGWMLFYVRDAPCSQYGSDFRGYEVVVDNPSNPATLYALKRDVPLQLNGQELSVLRSEAVRTTDDSIPLATNEPDRTARFVFENTYGSLKASIYPRSFWEDIPEVREAVQNRSDPLFVDAWQVSRFFKYVRPTSLRFDGKNFVFSRDGFGAQVWVLLQPTETYLDAGVFKSVIYNGKPISIDDASKLLYDPQSESIIQFRGETLKGESIFGEAH